MTLDNCEPIVKLCKRIYKETDPKRLGVLILDVNLILQRKVDELRRKDAVVVVIVGVTCVLLYSIKLIYDWLEKRCNKKSELDSRQPPH
jgi:hypothetical protein